MALTQPTVLVTRPEPQASEWVAALQARGQAAQALPLLQIEADPAFAPQVAQAWRDLAAVALVMFVSPNAVARFFAQAPGATAWPAATWAAATGPGTVRALQAAGVPEGRILAPRADAAAFDADTLWADALVHHDWQGRRVLIVRGETGRDWLAGQLRAAGAVLDIVSAYRSVPAIWTEASRQQVSDALQSPARALWLFSSSRAIEILSDHLAGQGALTSAWQALATHPRIAATARAAGYARVLEIRPDLDAVLAGATALASRPLA